MNRIIVNIEQGNILRINIPSSLKWSVIIFLIFWLTGWTIIGGHFAIQTVGQVGIGEVPLDMAFLLIIWMIMEVSSVYHLLWLIVGKEEIEISSDSIAIRHTILGIGRFRVFSSKHISGIRIDPAARIEPYSLAEEGINLNKGTGMIFFKYMGKTISMGIGLNQTEARELIATIHNLYPRYLDKNL